MKTLISNTVLTLLLTGFLLTGCGQSTQPDNVQVGPSYSSRTILFGREVTLEEGAQFGGVVGLRMDGNRLCTGLHLGNGYILTANHCINPEKRPSLTVYSPATRTVYQINTSYQASSPNPESFLKIKDSSVTQPDLTLVKTTGEAMTVLSRLPSVLLPTQALPERAANANIAGYGKSDLSADATVGKLKVGPAYVDKIDPLFYQLKFVNGSRFSAGLPGDSGGPLLVNENGKITVYGIASVFGANKESTAGGNLYVRLDTTVVKNWLRNQ